MTREILSEAHDTRQRIVCQKEKERDRFVSTFHEGGAICEVDMAWVDS